MNKNNFILEPLCEFEKLLKLYLKYENILKFTLKIKNSSAIT